MYQGFLVYNINQYPNLVHQIIKRGQINTTTAYPSQSLHPFHHTVQLRTHHTEPYGSVPEQAPIAKRETTKSLLFFHCGDKDLL